MSKKNNNYVSDSDELKAKKKKLLGNSSMDDIPKASSFDVKMDKQYLDGKKLSLSDIEGEEIVVFDAKITRSKFMSDITGDNKKMLVLQFGLVEENLDITYVIFTGASYLMEYIKQFKEKGGEFPFRATITKHGKSYMFD